MKRYLSLLSLVSMFAVVSPAFAGRVNLPHHKAATNVAANNVTEIITRAPGEPKFYDKHAAGQYQYWWWDYEYDGNYPAEIVWGDNGEVYFKDIISEGVTDSYVKGSVEGDLITVPLNQTVWFDDSAGWGLNLGVFHAEISYFDASGGAVSSPVEGGSRSFTFTLDESFESVSYKISPDGTVSLTGMPDDMLKDSDIPAYWVGYYYTDDLQYGGYAEYLQVFTVDDSNTPVSIPEGAEVEKYVMSDGVHGSLVDVAIYEGNLYIRGLNSEMPSATVMAAIRGDKAYLPQDQFMGLNVEYIYTKIVVQTDEDEYELADAEMEYVFDLNLENCEIVSDMEGYFLCFNASLTECIPTAVYKEISLSKNLEESGMPRAPIDVTYDDYFEYMGAGELMFYLSNISDTGALLNPENLYFRVFVDGEPLIFQEKEDPDFDIIYYGIEQPTELLPYGFNNQYDITIGDYLPDQYDVLLYNTDFTTVGVQLLYISDDVKLQSGISTLNKKTGVVTVLPGDTSNVGLLQGNASDAEEYFNLQGVRVSRPSKGVYILRKGNKTSKVAL